MRGQNLRFAEKGGMEMFIAFGNLECMCKQPLQLRQLEFVNL